jgi:prepilin-type N-terminal cleavage/methylation domain-containing protein
VQPLRAEAAWSDRRARGDGGFSLVEVVLAMTLLALVLAATGSLVVRALAGTGGATRAVTAATLANSALENARDVAAQNGTDGTTALLAGRTQALVDAVPTADLRLGDTLIAYGAASAAGPVLPLTSTPTVDGTLYTVRTVIGTCSRDAAGGPCDLAPGHVAPVTLHRVVAAVTWPGCARTECPVTATTLIDTARDPAFNALQDVLPVAVDKCFSTAAGAVLRFDPTYSTYTVRDTGDLGNAPVQIVVQPGQGTLAPNVGSPTWTYTPAAGSYTTQFTYRLVDRYTHYSAPAVITLSVGSGPC